MIHELKILPEYYEAVCSGEKTFEIRKNDRDYKVGDILHLKEWVGNKYTGKMVSVDVTYMLTDDSGYVMDGYVVMGIVRFVEW